MKVGFRKPSIKKSIKARTTGKLKRTVKKAVIPGYGKKGMGWVKDPKRAAYNKVYHKTTFGVSDLVKTSGSRPKSEKHYDVPQEKHTTKQQSSGCLLKVLAIAIFAFVGLPWLTGGKVFFGIVATFAAFVLLSLGFSKSEAKKAAEAEEKAPEDEPHEADDISES